MSTPVLDVRGLSRHFGGLQANADINLAVREGEVHALIGPNGAGKTTFIAQLSGLLRPDEGHVLFMGADITHMSAHRRVHAGLVRSFQITSIFPPFSVLDNLALALRQDASPGLSDLLRPWRAHAALFEQARQIAAQVGLAGREALAAGALAHGEQRQLEVGLALATRPHLLLLDEPMAGLGPEESERMIGLLMGLKGRLCMLLVEHDMDAVFRLADRISVLVAGRILASDVPEVIRINPDVRRAYLGDEIG